jgi:hypothetical protein
MRQHPRPESNPDLRRRDIERKIVLARNRLECFENDHAAGIVIFEPAAPQKHVD